MHRMLVQARAPKHMHGAAVRTSYDENHVLMYILCCMRGVAVELALQVVFLCMCCVHA